MKIKSDCILQPMLTEKSTHLESKFNEFVVVVDPKMTKLDVKKAIEDNFGVRPTEVRTAIFRKKSKRNRYGVTQPKSYKKAIVRLPEGKRLEMK